MIFAIFLNYLFHCHTSNTLKNGCSINKANAFYCIKSSYGRHVISSFANRVARLASYLPSPSYYWFCDRTAHASISINQTLGCVCIYIGCNLLIWAMHRAQRRTKNQREIFMIAFTLYCSNALSDFELCLRLA